MKDDQYMKFSGFYDLSLFQDFESHLRREIDLVEDDIELVLYEYKSSFITYELEPGIHTFKDLSEALFKFLQPEFEGVNYTIDIESHDFTMKTKIVVRAGTVARRFDQKSFFSTILGFTPGRDYKLYKEYISQKIVKLNTTNKFLLECDIIDRSVVNGVRQPILFSFV